MNHSLARRLLSPALLLALAVLAAAYGGEDADTVDPAWVRATSFAPGGNDNAKKLAVDRILEPLAEARDHERAAAFCELVLGKGEATNLPAAALHRVALTAAVIAAAGQPEDWTPPAPPPGLSPDDAAEAAFAVARYCMYARWFESARRLSAVRFPDVPRYAVRCVGRAPRDVGEWRASEYFRDPAARESRFAPYNEKAVALLAADVTVDREAIAAKTAAAGARPVCGVEFVVLADPDGLHLYAECRDDKVEEVMAGLAGGGTFEMFLQPGFDRAYHQWMFDIAERPKLTFVNWSSGHSGYRFLEDYLTYEIAPLADGFGVVMRIPWVFLFDCLPDAKADWGLGFIPWLRHGGFTWGHGQVHNLHGFGRLEFPDIEPWLPEIKRRIVLRAWAKFKRESEFTRQYWADEIHGDPAFAAGTLEPGREAYAALGEGMDSSLDGEVAGRLFSEAVPVWMNWDYWVSSRRAAHVREKLFAAP